MNASNRFSICNIVSLSSWYCLPLLCIKFGTGTQHKMWSNGTLHLLSLEGQDKSICCFHSLHKFNMDIIMNYRDVLHNTDVPVVVYCSDVFTNAQIFGGYMNRGWRNIGLCSGTDDRWWFVTWYPVHPECILIDWNKLVVTATSWHRFGAWHSLLNFRFMFLYLFRGDIQEMYVFYVCWCPFIKVLRCKYMVLCHCLQTSSSYQPFHCASDTVTWTFSVRSSEEVPLCLNTKIMLMETHQVLAVLILPPSPITKVMDHGQIGELLLQVLQQFSNELVYSSCYMISVITDNTQAQAF